MINLTSQRYQSKGQELGVDSTMLENAVNAINRIRSFNVNAFPLLTLNHLAHETDIPYKYLRSIVSRKIHPYRSFLMQKRIPGRKNKRLINVPNKNLLHCQQWITQHILKFGTPHSSSYAYHPHSNPVFAAQVHTSAEWLIKVDIHDFFHAISEHRIYDVFLSFGYSRLLSLELARICTIACERVHKKDPSEKYCGHIIQQYRTPLIGILPQGAPSSPMLSNLVMKEIDQALASLASMNNMRFSRYADDIVFSCIDRRSRKEINVIRREILTLINQGGFKPNSRKTVVRGPGERKIVWGILVNGSKPKLTKEYKDMVRLHLHYLSSPKFGPSLHAAARKTSISKIYHHVLGLIHWAQSVEPAFGNKALEKFKQIEWPPIAQARYFT